MKKVLLFAASVLLLTATAGFGQTAPATLEFEVASIKPSPPVPAGGSTASRASVIAQAYSQTTIDNAQARFRRASLSDLIVRAYRLRYYQLSGPDWIKSALFDIDAKLPEGASTDSVPEMLQALLADRFKLKLRREDHEFPVYALVVGKSGAKLTAKPPDYDPKKSNGLVAMTMENCAGLLSAGTDRPVVDRTGLDGQYMVSLQSITRVALARSISQQVGGPIPDKNADSFPDAFAIAEQMGLKLVPQKLALPLLTVESVEKTPTEN